MKTKQQFLKELSMMLKHKGFKHLYTPLRFDNIEERVQNLLELRKYGINVQQPHLNLYKELLFKKIINSNNNHI